MKKILFLLLSAIMPVMASAYDAYIDGIYYNFDKDAKTATVTYCSYNQSTDRYESNYTDTINILATVGYNGSTYTVTSIGDYAFEYCSHLTSVTIPNSVTSIGNGAFHNCCGLLTVKSYIKEPFDISRFDELTYHQGKLYIPNGTKELYISIDGWRDFLNIVEMEDDLATNGQCGTTVDVADIATIISTIATSAKKDVSQ